MRDLFNRIKWWWNDKCPRCGSDVQTKHYVGYRGEDWVQISRVEQCCIEECGYEKKVY